MKTAASFLAMFVMVAIAQEETTRQLWNTEFLKKRPASNSPAQSAAQPNYKPIAQPVKTPATPAGSGTMLGVTLWRMRDPKPSDAAGTRLLVLESNSEKREQTPERVDSGTPLTKGDHVRLTVEVPATGYLYVIDRERYADGTLSDAYLIYPNEQTRQGDNVVAPGRLVEIPDRRDEPNAFTIRPSRADQNAEVLSLLVSPEPLPNMKAGTKPMKLDAALYAGWEKKWGVKAERFELEGGAGQTITAKENQPGANVTQDDPLPQTLYRVNAKPGNAVLLEIPLQMKK
jgi:hypothetical protein